MGQIYWNIKLLHFPQKLDDLKHKRITPPVHIRIKPTNACNHNCWYCGYQSDDANITLGDSVNKKDSIPYEKMVEISEDLIDMNVKAVTFTGGGEPMIYPYIKEFAQRLMDGGIKISFITNGAFLKGELAKILANRASWIRISMDGYDDESYRAYRRVKSNEYTKITNNIEAFAKIKGNTTLGTSLNLDKDNYKHVYKYIKHMKDIGVEHVKISGTVVSNIGSENNEYHAPFFDEAMNLIEQAKSDFDDGSFRVINLYHHLPELFKKTYTTCPFLQFLTVIGADQKVYTCQDKAYTPTGELGSIENISFKEFWNSKECKTNLEILNPVKVCQHHCVADSKNKMILDYLNINYDHLEFV